MNYLIFILKPCANNICMAYISGECGKPLHIDDDLVCELGQTDKMIPHYKTQAYIPSNFSDIFACRVGFITLQSGELIYK